MIKDLKKQKAFDKNYFLYQNACDKLKRAKVLNLKTLQRVLSPYAKTTLLNNTILTYKLKNNNVNVCITLLSPVEHQTTNYFNIRLSTLPSLEISLSADNLKDLMHKINHSYKFLKN